MPPERVEFGISDIKKCTQLPDIMQKTRGQAGKTWNPIVNKTN